MVPATPRSIRTASLIETSDDHLTRSHLVLMAYLTAVFYFPLTWLWETVAALYP